MKLHLKVVPGASRESHEWMDAEKSLLKVRVTAAPEKGKANRAVEKYLAGQLGVPAREVSIVSGNTSQKKVAEIAGLAETSVQAKLSLA